MSGRLKPRILCLSRSTSRLRLIVSHLSHEEFEAVTASTPEEAVALCTANHVTAIVLDSEFVTESGWTVAQSFRMVAPHLPIVLVKANHDHEVPVGIDAVAAGADVVIGTLKRLLANGTPERHDAALPQPKLPFVRQFKTDVAANKIPDDDGKPNGS
jgi:CheY-like chemotaxis protein